MYCQLCLSPESPSLLDMRDQFFIFKGQRMDLLSCFNYCKQIKIENEQNAKICESCLPKITTEYISKQVKCEETTSVTSIFQIAEIKQEPELNLDSKYIFQNVTTKICDLVHETVLPKEEITTEAVSSYQIIYLEHEAKEEPELQIDENVDGSVLTEHAEVFVTTIPENYKKNKHSECSTVQRYKGDVCAETFKTERTLLTHEDSKDYQCHQCSAIFKTDSVLDNHLRKTHPANRFKCLYCVRSFKLKTNMLKHMDAHSDFKKYPCKDCSEAFNTRAKLCFHFKKTHTMDKSAIRMPRAKIKKKHILHHGEGTHKCSYCDKQMKTSHKLEVHELSHTDTEHYRCTHNQCTAVFNTQLSLNYHMRYLHSTERFKCLYCFKTFKVKSTLTQHMDTHSDTKRYPCKHCSEGFSTRSKLKVHFRKTHSTEEFQCHYCSAIKKSKDLIRSHLLHHVEGKRGIGHFFQNLHKP